LIALSSPKEEAQEAKPAVKPTANTATIATKRNFFMNGHLRMYHNIHFIIQHLFEIVKGFA
jgi:hypothetical protein